MSRKIVTAFTVFLAGSVLAAEADELQGEIVRPLAEMPLRASPPGSFFRGKGPAIDVVHPDDRYRVITSETVRTFAGSQDWVELESLSEPSTTGWVYAGPSDSSSSNLQSID